MKPGSRILHFPGYDDAIDAVPVDTPAVQSLKAKRERRKRDRYVKGPIPWQVVTAANAAHPRGLALYLAIIMQASLTRSQDVIVTSTLCNDLGIGREMKRRVLIALTEAGLVAIMQRPGKLTRVRLLDISDG